MCRAQAALLVLISFARVKRSRYAVLLVAGLLSNCLLLTGCGEKAAPNVLLVTFDTTRADHMGYANGRSGVTPTLDDLAGEARRTRITCSRLERPSSPRRALFFQSALCLARAYEGLAESEKALSWYRRALAIDPTNAAACGAGNLLKRHGDLDEAEKYFREAVRAAPHQALGYVHMASLMTARGRRAEAEEWLAKAHSAEPDSGLTAAGTARDLVRAGKRAEALAILERAHSHDSTSPAVESMIGDLRIQQRDWAGAEPYLRRTVNLRRTDAVSWDNLGAALAHLNQLIEAKSCFEKFLSLDPGRTQAALNLGTLELAEGNPRRALSLAEDVLHRNPSLVQAAPLRDKAAAALPRSGRGRTP